MTPENPTSLISLFKSIGLVEVITGVDLESSAAKSTLEGQIQYWFRQSSQSAQDKSRRDQALAAVGLYPWASADESADKAVAEIMKAVATIREVRSLLEEEQTLDPVEVVGIEEDGDGNAIAINIARD